MIWTWETKDGTVIKISKMSTENIRNAMKTLQNRIECGQNFDESCYENMDAFKLELRMRGEEWEE